MAAPKTVLTYPLNGTLKDFAIPFEYLARKFVVVTLIGATRRVLVLNSEYRFTTKKQITTTTAWGPAQGFENIEIRRMTSATERLVDFSDGSILRAYDLNTAQIQSLHIAEEARDLTADTIGVNNDGDLDARGRRIVNLADATQPDHAVTLRQEQAWAASTLAYKNAAEASASASEISRQGSTTKASESAASAALSGQKADLSEASRVASVAAKVAAEAARDLALSYRDTAGVSAANSEASRVAAVAAKVSSEAARDLSLQYSLNAAIEAANAQGVGVTFIDGIIPSRHLTTSTIITFGAGSAIIESTGKLIRIPSPITIDRAGLNTMNAWHYAYLYDAGSGAPGIEINTTVPAAPYAGMARSKTGDTSRRFIGAFKTGLASTGFYLFQWMPDNTIQYLEAANTSPFRLTNASAPTTPTTISAANTIPPTSRYALLIVSNSAASSSYDTYLSNPDVQPRLLRYIGGGGDATARGQVAIPTDSLQRISAWMSNTAAGGGFSIDIIGYGFER